jgi:hypothetical protein
MLLRPDKPAAGEWIEIQGVGCGVRRIDKNININIKHNIMFFFNIYKKIILCFFKKINIQPYQ